jgi:glycosyltransferase involved in cell wall biosynthesis
MKLDLPAPYQSAGRMRLRILQVVPSYYPAVRYGGPIRSVHALSAALVGRGHSVSVFTTNVDGDQNLDVPVGVPVPLDGVQVSYFSVPALRRLYWCPSLGRRLKEVIREFDVVHLHSVYLWPTFRAARIAHDAGVPYIMSPRGMLVRDVIRRKSRFVKSAWIHLVERRSLSGAAALHVTAPLEGEEIRAMGFQLPRTVCIPNGVAFPGPSPHRGSGIFADLPRPYALFLSRINWKKGLDRLLMAWREVPELHLIIAGNDDEGYEQVLKRTAAESGLLDRVHFVGPVSDQDKWPLYRNAELFVLPSYSENFGNVVAEAMAMGCPVVVTPEVGLASLVRQAGAGIVTDGEPQPLARAIRELHADELSRKRFGVAGQQAAIEHLTWERAARDMESLYRAVLRR